MTLLTLISKLNEDDFSLHNIAVNWTWQLIGVEMSKASWGGNLVFEDTGECLGNFQISEQKILISSWGGSKPPGLLPR